MVLQCVFQMTEDSLVYTFTLNYNPQALGSAPVVRTSQAVVIVECHYPRCHDKFTLLIQNANVETTLITLNFLFPNIYISMFRFEPEFDLNNCTLLVFNLVKIVPNISGGFENVSMLCLTV